MNCHSISMILPNNIAAIIVKTFGYCDNGITIDHWLGLGYKISGVTVSKVYMTK